jgi:hypothetical protein
MMMPIVMCKWCEYIGSGDTSDEQWSDVAGHELANHLKEIKEGE